MARVLAAVVIVGAGHTGAQGAVAAAEAAGSTTRVSVPNVEGDRDSANMDVSGDGRYVAFISRATNLVPGDTNALEDYFVRDVVLARTTKVSVGSDGVEADGAPPLGGDTPSISSDGRYVAFASFASNLVPDDTNLASDVFVHDRQTAQTTRVSVGARGEELPHSSDAPAISADGRHVSFTYGPRAGLPATTEVLVHDRQTGETQTVSVSTDGIPSSGLESAISGDGRLVVFSSLSPALVAGDTNAAYDAFVHDRVTGRTDRISVASDGTQASGASRRPAISENGRYVGFSSTAPELVPGDTNGGQDVFVRDLQTGSLSRASVSSDGSQGDGGSAEIGFDADGSTVSFLSTAENLVPGDTNGSTDVFVRDAHTGTTTRRSVASDGGQADNGVDSSSALSGDGRMVAFASRSSDLSPGDTNGLTDVFFHDRVGGTTRVSVADAGQADAASSDPVLTHDGHMIAFASSASNLVREDTNSADDIFVAHAEGDAGASSISVGGLAASVEPSVSGDGRFVAFSSRSTNLVPGDGNGFGDVFVRDRAALFDHTTRVSDPEGPAQAVGHSYSPAISADGRFVAFVSEARNLVPGDTNGVADVFVYDRDTAATTRASVKGAGTQANGPSGQPSISADGRHLAFTSWATNLTSGDTNGVADVFVRDLTAGATQRVSVSQATIQAGRTSDSPSISGDGTAVAFRSDAKNLVAGDTNGAGDVFVRNMVALTTTRVSVASDGTEATGPSSAPAISAGAGIVAFGSKATNLVSGDTNGVADVFVHALASGATERVSVSSGGKQGNGASSAPAVSADGKTVAFVSKATNLVAGDTNRAADIFLRRR